MRRQGVCVSVAGLTMPHTPPIHPVGKTEERSWNQMEGTKYEPTHRQCCLVD